MINIGDRVAYDDEDPADPDELGTVVAPTEQERYDAEEWEYPPTPDSLMIEWDDGQRSWEDPDGLVVVQGAGS